MITRTLEPYLKKIAKKYPVINITGPRQSGKTTLCCLAFSNFPYVSLEELDTREFAINDPRGFLKAYPKGAVIDEIQKCPDLTSYIQTIVDNPRFTGKFILTGSQNFSVTNIINQSLAGRTAMLTLLPFSLSELQNVCVEQESDDYMLKGFYPRLYDKDIPAVQFYSDYITTYIERDIRDFLRIKDLIVFQRFLKLCAGRSAQLLNITNLASDAGITQKTASEWLAALEASYIIYRLPPFFKNVGKRLTKSPKLFFYDPGLMAHLLGIKEKSQIIGHPLRGSIFETMVVSDFLKKRINKGLRNNFHFYRDSGKNEVDLIFTKKNSLIPVEIKSGKTINHDYFKNLRYFRKVISEAAQGMLIYDGEENRVQYDTKVVGFSELHKDVFS